MAVNVPPKFPSELVVGDKDGKVDRQIICGICHCLLVEPLESSPCYHAFCGDCYKGWQTKSAHCPDPACGKVLTQLLESCGNRMRTVLVKTEVRCQNSVERGGGGGSGGEQALVPVPEPPLLGIGSSSGTGGSAAQGNEVLGGNGGGGCDAASKHPDPFDESVLKVRPSSEPLPPESCIPVKKRPTL